MKNTLLIVLLAAVVAGGGWWWYQKGQMDKVAEVNSYEECVAAGYPILESYPEKCLTPDGRSFINESAAVNAPEDGAYKINIENSEVFWEGKKKYITGYVDRGMVSVSSGELKIENGLITEGKVIVDMATIAASETGRGSGESMLSNHLKSDAFFDAETYPTATLVIISGEAGEGKNGQIIKGKLTIKEAVQNIAWLVTVARQEDGSLSLTGEAVIDRSLYDVRFGSESFFNNLGDNAIEDNFKIIFSVVAEK